MARFSKAEHPRSKVTGRFIKKTHSNPRRKTHRRKKAK